MAVRFLRMKKEMARRDDIVRLISDRDGTYGAAFNARVDTLGIKQVKIAPRHLWQNGSFSPLPVGIA
jgi:hypothetical protein